MSETDTKRRDTSFDDDGDIAFGKKGKSTDDWFLEEDDSYAKLSRRGYHKRKKIKTRGELKKILNLAYRPRRYRSAPHRLTSIGK